MADAPWRCSQCGTVNEPVANACRTCGRWPSLFELEGSTIEADAVERRAPVEVWDPEMTEAAEPEYPEPEAYDVGEPLEVEELDVDEEAEQPKPLWKRLASFIVPIGVVLYIVISALVNNDAG